MKQISRPGNRLTGFRPLLFLWIFAVLSISLSAQGNLGGSAEDIMAEARAELDTLTSDYMAGRGYINEGHIKAARYLAARFEELGLQALLPASSRPDNMGGFAQPFPIRINLISGGTLALDGIEYAPGADFIVNPFSGSAELSGIKVKDMGYGLKPKASVRGKIVVIRDGWPSSMVNDAAKKKQYEDLSTLRHRVSALLPYKPEAILVLKTKLTAMYSRERVGLPIIELKADRWPGKVKKASVTANTAIREFPSQNLIGYLEGTTVTDTAILLTAHYDHLGKLETAIFPGANDNASGSVMLLSMAEYLVRHPLRYSVVFILFGGEETGLLGSGYYVNESPVYPLSRSKFILNLDLMGNGDEGIMAVGGREFPTYLDQLRAINDSLDLVSIVRKRANAPNSDHYYFLRKGVPGFFVYTLGGPPNYHDVNDTAANLPFSRFLEVRELLLRFLEGIQ